MSTEGVADGGQGVLPTSLRVAPPAGRLTPDVWVDPCRAPKLLSIREASYLMQVPIKTLYRWNSEGRLHGIATRVGKQLRIDRDGLLRLWTHAKKTTH